MRCMIARWYLSRSLDQGKGIPAWVKGHVAQCPDCARAHASLLQVHRSLSVQAVEMRQGHQGLPSRAHNPAVPLTSRPANIPATGGFRFRLVLGSAGALATLILVALWQNPRARSDAFSGPSTLWTSSWKLPVEQAWMLPEKLENPLHQEVDQLKSTIGQAGRFLYDSIRIHLPGERGGS